MSQTGIGVMIQSLGGNEESVTAYQRALHQRIAEVRIDPEGDGALRFVLEGGQRFCIRDEGRSCCEHRYMHTDDDLGAFVGATFEGVEVVDGPEETDQYGEPKESAFLKVRTSAGGFTVVTYNKHNGYYGGFWIVCE